MSTFGRIDLGGTKIHAATLADSRPPHVHVAALGDLGGAIGAPLLVRGEA